MTRRATFEDNKMMLLVVVEGYTFQQYSIARHSATRTGNGHDSLFPISASNHTEW